MHLPFKKPLHLLTRVAGVSLLRSAFEPVATFPFLDLITQIKMGYLFVVFHAFRDYKSVVKCHIPLGIFLQFCVILNL